jgi:hypothetical protein
MATDYKILGQVQTSDAPAQENINLYPDPNHERFTSDTTFNAPSPAKGASIWVWDTTSHNTSHAEQHWTTSAGPSGTTTSGRTGYPRFSTHENTGGGHGSHHQRRWNLDTDLTGTLTAGKTYTLDLWAHAHNDSSNHHGQHSGNILEFWDGANWQSIVAGYPGEAHSHLSNFNNTSYQTQIQTDSSGNRASWNGGFRRWYKTFTAAGTGKFNMRIMQNQYNTSMWCRMYIDNIYVAEGAIPKALIPSRAPDGTSGNPLALYTSPFTTRSEGWSGTAYQSTTTRKFTGDWQNLYVVPDVVGTTAVCSTLVISNASTSTQTYRIAVQKYGETLSQKHFIAFDHSISANSMETLTLGITLARQDKIIVQSDSNRLQFSLFGSENSL